MDVAANLTGADVWSDWLLRHRSAGDPRQEQIVAAKVEEYVNRILGGVELAENATILDLGSGKGVVLFRAFERAGMNLHAIFTDISQPLLRIAEAEACARNIRSQCTFLLASADQLSDVAFETVDVVTSRSTLAYVADKRTAFLEAFRVLKGGGWLSIGEPVMRDEALSVVAMKNLLEERPTIRQDSLLPYLHRWKSAQYPDTEEKLTETAITNYTERDLVCFAQATGFVDIHMEFHVHVASPSAIPWDVFVRRSPHPLAPTLQQILEQKFTVAEQKSFIDAVRPFVEAGKFPGTDRMAFLRARKPLR